MQQGLLFQSYFNNPGNQTTGFNYLNGFSGGHTFTEQNFSVFQGAYDVSGLTTYINTEVPGHSMTTYGITQNDNFAISFQGYFYAGTPGNYTFYFYDDIITAQKFNNDDLSMFYINAPALNPTPLNYPSNYPNACLTTYTDSYNFVANSSLTITLTAGYHPIRLLYGQSAGGKSVALGFSTPDNPGVIQYDGSNNFFYSPFTYPCFLGGTMITCMNPNTNREESIPIENLKKGDLVRTLNDGYKPVHGIGRGIIYNSGTDRIRDRLYRLKTSDYPDLTEDLILTGAHSILVNKLTEQQKEQTLEALKSIFITDDKFRLMAYLDDKSVPYEKEGTFPIYHIALESENKKINYGIYANRLLVETCNIDYLEKHMSLL
jgi:hypothetical protein